MITVPVPQLLPQASELATPALRVPVAALLDRSARHHDQVLNPGPHLVVAAGTAVSLRPEGGSHLIARQFGPLGGFGAEHARLAGVRGSLSGRSLVPRHQTTRLMNSAAAGASAAPMAPSSRVPPFTRKE